MKTPKIGFISLGCPKALVDSERILTKLRSEGYEVAPNYDGADMVVVNTCGFIDAAVEESLDSIGEAIAENGKVIVTGCLGARADEILERHPQVLEITGAHALDEVVAAVHKHLPPLHDPYSSLVPPQGIKLTPKHYAYLKIAEGCNHRCTFCIIPSMRGDLVSRPVNEVLLEAKRLADAGVKELLVVSQDTSAYGLDLKYQAYDWQGKEVRTRFYEMAEALGELGVWVRMHYVYPYPHVDEVVPLMAAGKILPYLDIPFQHANTRILKLMKRPAATENNLQRIKAWRTVCPDIILRSTFIVGFPGETEAEFQELLNFLTEAQLDRVGCFAYSPVKGAVANDLPDSVAEEVKQDRLARFMAHQAEISAARLQLRVGRIEQVIIDEVVAEGAVARSKADAPEIDGQVYIDGATHLKVGDLVNVEIEEVDDYDMWGRLLN
ncbi:MAG: 30S ribosomal protein S12 methylthiotransferase RimO [Gammaproteobacteria bacterium]|jgi:ribosomal protein S12 methylthiotransferase|nr:30S ribosomal protein S12 methylthiotransferase RimO [Gammaproteobacteria bacterium]MBT5223156.1 30S ribosomal protein S12 methylthiotransferase RimO [Gammaproteobacteria bacterium]MBT5824709.1 30S ribosomal protein S12 methylthiotransferase RimO [Gammaproteobacteria bacterium]MBT6421244.1 30S ribosomal protein S12 methylthiotransferase RimO [Gammaproteobacteria bacterium]MBT6576783.1 30S ribosomal protein S12 methylthiotransferase RimO [Gammaproteobacteria bacterium]